MSRKRASSSWIAGALFTPLFVMAFALSASVLGGCAATTKTVAEPSSTIRRAQLEAAAKVTPPKPGVLRDLGWARYFDGDRVGAKIAFEEALAQDDAEPRARFGMAILDDEAGRFAAEREQLTRILEAAADPISAKRGEPDTFAAAIAVAATASLERLLGEVAGEDGSAQRLARIDVSKLDPELAQRVLALRAGHARLRGNEAEALRLDLLRGCPATMVTTTSYGHLPHLDLARHFAPEDAKPWPKAIAAADWEGALDAIRGDEKSPRTSGDSQLPPTPFTTELSPTRSCDFGIVTPQGQPGVAYAQTFVHADRGLIAHITIGSDQPFNLIVDGVTLYRHDSALRYPARMRSLDVPLASGWHRVLLKVAAPGSRVGIGLRMSAVPALSFASDEPAHFSPRPPRASSVRIRAESDRLAQSAMVSARARTEQPLLADLLAGLWSVRDGDLDAATDILARLRTAAPKFVPGFMLSAQLADADVSRPHRLGRDLARRHLERALSLDPACLLARYELAEMDIQEDHADKALARLAAAPATGVPQVLAPEKSKNGTSEATGKVAATLAGTRLASAGAAMDTSVSNHATTSAVDGFRIDLARYRALKARGWIVEAEHALADAGAANPESCAPIAAQVQLAKERRDYARVTSLAKSLVACTPESDELAQAEREAGDPVAAAAEYRRLIKLDPTRLLYWDALADALAAAGLPARATVVLSSLVAHDPRVVSYRRELADELLALGNADGARRTLLAGFAMAPESEELHRALAALGEPGVIDPFRVDGKKVIAAFEASGAHYDSPAVIVLDRTVTRVFATGARLTLTHNIVRVQTKDGIDKWGEVQVPEGAEVLLLRTVKADGTTREPEEIAEKQSTSVPDLAPGDYVEFEYLDPSGAAQAFPGGFYGERFYFQSFDAPLDRTEYVLATPKHMPVQIDRRGAAPEVVLSSRADAFGVGEHAELDVRTWSDHRKSQLVVEPQEAPFSEEVPSVRAGSAIRFADWRDFLDEQEFGAMRGNAELRALAEHLKTPQAMDGWVRLHIKQGGTLDDSGSAILARGEGSRVVLLRALLAAVGVPSEIRLARSRASAVLDGPLPDLEAYNEAVLAIRKPGTDQDWSKTDLVVDPRFRHAQAGFLAPLLRDVPALSLGAGMNEAGEAGEAPGKPSEPSRIVTLPGSTAGEGKDADANPDRRRVHLDATLAADGGADVTVVETLRGWPALEWREGLDRINEDRVRAEFEQHTLGFYFPGASLTDLRFEGRDHDEQPLIVTYKFHAPSFARVEGKSLVVPAPYPALLGKRYVGVAERKTPLQLSYAAPTELDAVIHVPQGATLTVSPAVSPVRSSLVKTVPGANEIFGLFAQEPKVEAGALHLHALFSMPPVRVPASSYAAFRSFADTVDQAEERIATVVVK